MSKKKPHTNFSNDSIEITDSDDDTSKVPRIVEIPPTPSKADGASKHAKNIRARHLSEASRASDDFFQRELSKIGPFKQDVREFATPPRPRVDELAAQKAPVKRIAQPGQSPLRSLQSPVKPQQPFLRVEQAQRSVWFDALTELDIELGWSIMSKLICKQTFNSSVCMVPYLSDNYFYYPNFGFVQKPAAFVDQFVRGRRNNVLPLGSVLSLANEVTRSMYMYLRESLTEEETVAAGYKQKLEDAMLGMHKGVTIELGPIRKFSGRTFESSDIRLSLTMIAQLLHHSKSSPSSPQSKNRPPKLPKKLYVANAAYIADFMHLTVGISENVVKYDKLDTAIAFQCTKYHLAADGTLEEPVVMPVEKLLGKDWIHSANVKWFDESGVSTRPRVFDIEKLILGKDMVDEE